MRYYSSFSYNSPFVLLFTKFDKNHENYNLIANLIQAKIDYDTYKKTFNAQLFELEKELKLHHEHHMLMDYEQYEMCYDDFMREKREIEEKINKFKKEGAILQSRSNNCKETLRIVSPELFKQFISENSKLSKKRQEEYKIISTILKHYHTEILFVLKNEVYHDVSNLYHKYGYKELNIEQVKFVNGKNLLLDRHQHLVQYKQSFSPENLMSIPLCNVVDIVNKLLTEIKNNREHYEYIVENDNMKSTVRDTSRLLKYEKKLIDFVNDYNLHIKETFNYKLIVIK